MFDGRRAEPRLGRQQIRFRDFEGGKGGEGSDGDRDRDESEESLTELLVGLKMEVVVEFF